MTDLAPGGAGTHSCPNCGNQNPLEATTCDACGAVLEPPRGHESERGDVETIEVERAVGAAGFDTVFGIDGDVLACPMCGHRFRIADTRVHDAVPAVDTVRSDDTAGVITCNCPNCHTPGHAVLAQNPS